MEPGKYVVPFTIYVLSELDMVYATWITLVLWMLHDCRQYYTRRDVMMFSHHVLTIFICYWLLLFESDGLLIQWTKVAGLLEISGCSTSVYCCMSGRGYWDKATLLMVYCTLRFYYVPLILIDLGSVNACVVPLGSTWFIVCTSVWWIKRIFLSFCLQSMQRMQPTIRYLAAF